MAAAAQSPEKSGNARQNPRAAFAADAGAFLGGSKLEALERELAEARRTIEDLDVGEEAAAPLARPPLRPDPRGACATHDDAARARRKAKAEKINFDRVRAAEAEYARALRGIANQVGKIARAFGNNPEAASLIEQALAHYQRMIGPFAEATAKRMLAEVARRDEAEWAKMARTMSRNLRAEIADSPTGSILQALLDQQVKLITSLPRQAAERVHELAAQATFVTGARAREVAKEIARTNEVTESRAMLIARTEVARASSSLVQARAQHVGSEGYFWRTSRDGDVRRSHRRMEGKFVRWDDPPTLDNLTGHAGALPNCRCWPDPVIPE